MKDNKRFMDNNGKLFWPKLNATTDNANSMQAQNDPNDGVGLVFHLRA
jgi:hypothetical protein